MKFVSILFVFVVGALAGGLVSPVLTGSTDREVTGLREGADREGPGRSATTEPVSATPVPAAARLEEESSAKGEDSLLARAIASVEPVDVGVRDGRIDVSVQVVGGGPLSGVEFTASPPRRPDREDAQTLEQKVRRTIRDLRYSDDLRRTATSDEDGHALLTSIGEGRYRIRAKASGYRFEGLGTAGAAEAGDTVEFLATPVATVALTVVRADGSLADKARVTVERGNQRWGTDWQGSDPMIEVDPGPFTIEVRHEGGEVGRSASQIAEAGTAPLELRIDLEARARIEAVVRFPAGERVEYATVFLLPAAMKSDATPEDLLNASQQQHSHNGSSVAFEDLDPGGYWIGAARGWGHDGHEPSLQFVEVSTGSVEIEVPIPASDLSKGVVVQGFSPSGHLVPDLQVSLRVESDGGGSRSGGGTQTRLADGSILIGPDDSMRTMFESPGGKATVSASSGNYGGETIEIAAFDGTTYEVRFQDPATARVAVPGYLGSEVFGKVRVRLEPAGREERHAWFSRGGSDGKPDETGSVEFTPLSPGEYTARLFFFDERDGRWRSTEIARQPVTVVSGENSFSILLPPLYSVEVQFPEGVATGNLQLSLIDSVLEGVYASAPIVDGVATIDGLVAGEYNLSAWGAGISRASAMTIVVPTGGPIFYDPPPVNAIRVTVSDPDGAMARAGFVDGDVIRRINGQPFEGEEQLAMLGMLLQGAREVTITVGRDGGEIELVLNPKEMMQGNPGGRFQPTSE